MTNLKTGLRKQKHLCPFCNQSLVNNKEDLTILYLDGDKHNHNAKNIVVLHKRCHEGNHAETIEIEKENGNTSNSRVPITTG
jgi:5-methylcytosine-specific restriction endonuclease McrA